MSEFHICRYCGRKGTRGFVFEGKAGVGAYFDPQSQSSCSNRKACAVRQKAAERPSEQFYAYLVTDVWGTQVGKVEPGQYMLEPEYKGNGSYTWTIYDFGKRGTPLSASITGRYVGIVHGENGQLDEPSKAFLAGEQAQGGTP